MSDEPAERPRTWGPLLAAAGIGGIVLIGAVVAFAVEGGPDEREAAVIAACEAAHATESGQVIVAGEVYDPTQWRAHHTTVAEEDASVAEVDALSAEVVQEREARAERFGETGDGTFVIVWRLEDGSRAQCVAPVSDGAVDATRVTVGPPAVELPALDG